MSTLKETTRFLDQNREDIVQRRFDGWEQSKRTPVIIAKNRKIAEDMFEKANL